MSLLDKKESFKSKVAELISVLAIFTASLFGGIYVSGAVFDNVPHVEDELAYLFQAKVFAKGMVYAPAPTQPDFFDIPFIVNYEDKWFGKYTPGYPLVLALGVMAGAPWLVNPVFGALSLVLIYFLGKSLYGPLTGALAAGMGLVSPLFLLQSGSFMSHPATLFFVLVFILCFLKVYRGGSIVYAAFAGGSLGMVFLSRPLTGVALGLPFLVLGLLNSYHGGWQRFRKYLTAALVFAIFPLLLLGFNQILTGNPFKNTYELWWSFDRIGFGNEFGVAGHTFIRGIDNTAVNLTALSSDLFGWPFYLSLVFIPIPLLLDRNKWDLLLFAIFFSVAGLYVAYWTPGLMYGPRYYFEAFPALLLLTARGILITSDRAGNLSWKPFSGSRRPAGFLIVILVVIGLVAANLTDYLPRSLASYRDWYDINGNNLRAVRQAGIHNAVVFVTKDKAWSAYGSVASAVDPTLDSDIVFAMDRKSLNILLMREYPGREYYLLEKGILKKLGQGETP